MLLERVIDSDKILQPVLKCVCECLEKERFLLIEYK